MSTAAATLVTGFHNSPGKIRAMAHKAGGEGHAVFKFNYATFNATTNPSGIRNLGASDTAVIAVTSSEDSATPSNIPVSPSTLVIDTIRCYSNKTFALGTANSVNLRIVRSSTSSLPDVNIVNITEAGGFGVVDTLTGIVDVDLILGAGDKIVLVPDGAISTASDATAFQFIEVSFKRLIAGGRLSVGSAVA